MGARRTQGLDWRVPGVTAPACGVSEEPGWWESLAGYLAHIRYSIKIPWIVCCVMSFDMKAQVKFD